MTRSATHRLWLALYPSLCLTLSLASSTVRADVVGPAPDSCPSGGTPSSCHAGPYCALTECEADSECTVEGTVCREVPVCEGKVVCAGLVAPDADLSQYERATVESACQPGDACPDRTRCALRRLCAPRAREPSTPARPVGDEDKGCAVRAPSPDRPPTLAIALALAIPWLGCRRRRA
jgi:hypothetical protein